MSTKNHDAAPEAGAVPLRDLGADGMYLREAWADATDGDLKVEITRSMGGGLVLAWVQPMTGPGRERGRWFGLNVEDIAKAALAAYRKGPVAALLFLLLLLPGRADASPLYVSCACDMANTSTKVIATFYEQRADGAPAILCQCGRAATPDYTTTYMACPCRAGKGFCMLSMFVSDAGLDGSCTQWRTP